MSLIYPLGPAGSVNLGSAAPAALALDGSAIGTVGSGTTCTATLTTTTANDIIIAAVEYNTPPIIGITDTAGLTWNLISNQPRAAVYYAKSAGILTGDVVTATIQFADFISMHVFAVKGANFAAPLDANGALPATSGAAPALLSLTTSTPDGFLFGAYRADPGSTAGAGWTTISGANYLLTVYKIVSATQSGTSVPIGTGNGTQLGAIGHSIRAGGIWTPASISTAFWFDADNAASITASGGAVSQWNDLSGNARHATQATGGLKFTDTASVQNGKHGLRSSNAAGSNMATAGFTVSQPFIICAAFKTVSFSIGSTFPILLDGSTTASGNRPIVFSSRGDNGLMPAIYASTLLNATSGGEANATPYYMTCVFNGASSVIRENGVQIGSGAAGASGITGLIISSTSGTNLDSFDGYYLELFCIQGTSSTDIANAEAYLASKWSIP